MRDGACSIFLIVDWSPYERSMSSVIISLRLILKLMRLLACYFWINCCITGISEWSLNSSLSFSWFFKNSFRGRNGFLLLFSFALRLLSSYLSYLIGSSIYCSFLNSCTYSLFSVCFSYYWIGYCWSCFDLSKLSLLFSVRLGEGRRQFIWVDLGLFSLPGIPHVIMLVWI